MTYIRVRCAIQIQLPDGSVHVVGDTTSPGAITGAEGDVTDVRHDLGTGTSKIIWDAGEASGGETPTASTFLFGYVVSDLDDVELEIAVDIGADVATALHTVQLKKNVPYLLPSKVAYAGDYTANWGAGTLDNIERIRARNPSTSTAATVRVVLAR